MPDYQLSLAIGKEGQNARLAAKLTNWKIDIKSETQFDEYLDENGQTMEEFREDFENTAVQDEEIGSEESPAEEIKEYDNFASIGGLTGMDLNDLFVDASSDTSEDETEVVEDSEVDEVPDSLADDE